jgi:hypothetical protein
MEKAKIEQFYSFRWPGNDAFYVNSVSAMKWSSRISKLLLLAGITLLCQAAASQDIVMDTIVARISALAGSCPSETVYLQTSKGIYETGEDLWFRACVFEAQTFALSAQSQTLYLQMIGETDGRPVWQEKYPIENGIAAGHVYVQDGLPDGNYFLEACTGHSFYADSTAMTAVRKVRIVQNINQNDKPALPAKDSSFRFETFPEGGNLIAGVSSKLAFKATDGRGYPVEVKGTLYQDGDSLLDFQSAHAGMGFMEFTPETDRMYQIRLSNGETYPLPEVHPQGMTFRLSGRDSTFLEFEVQQTGEQPAPFYLTGQLRGMVCCAAKGVLRQSQTVRLPLDEFPHQGIVVFTLYDRRIRPVAERLVYIHPERELCVTAELEKKYYLTREKITVKIKTTDEKGVPVPAHLGVSISDSFYDNPEDPANILTHCYLTSQIRGKIYNPAYYFDEKNADRQAAMDLLLLTQGWRRYVWQADRPAPIGQAVIGDEITGIQTIQTIWKRQKEQVSLQVVKVSDAEKNAQFVAADSTGHFVIDAGLLKTLNPGYIYLKPMLPDEFNPELHMDDPFEAIGQVRGIKEIFYPLADPDAAVEKEREERPVAVGDVVLLDEVTVTGKSRKPVRDKYMGRLDSLVRMNLEGPWVCEHGWLENYLPGYTHHHDPKYCPCPDFTDRFPPVEGRTYPIGKYNYKECTFTVEDRRTIDYHGPVYSDEELLRMNGLWRVKGYYGVREFYHPDEIDMQSSLPDARNTLFWSPSVVTDENGEATVSFYCSDLNTTFTGRIEGTDGAGLLGLSKFDFRVIKIPTVSSAK